MSAFTELGFGHTNSAEHYIEGWEEVLQPDGWSEDGTERLKDLSAEATSRKCKVSFPPKPSVEELL